MIVDAVKVSRNIHVRHPFRQPNLSRLRLFQEAANLIGIPLAKLIYGETGVLLMRSKMNNFHYQLAQACGLTIDFVALGHIRCCRYPHRDMPESYGERALSIPYRVIPVFGNPTFNHGATTAIFS